MLPRLLCGQAFSSALVSRFLVVHDIQAGRFVEAGAAWDASGNDFYVLMLQSAKNNEPVVKVMTWLTARSSEDT
jgi:LysR family glycine cleavage system transcriptional activator